MKGTAHIVVKDKYGNIKTNTTEHNIITDTFKNQMQAWLNGADKYQYIGNIPKADEYYFNGIFLHETTVSDDKDLQIPCFIGSQAAKSDTSNVQYSAAGSHEASDTKISSTWTWTADKAYTIKSLTLHDNQFANRFDARANYYDTSQIWKLNANKWLKCMAQGSGNGYASFCSEQTSLKYLCKKYGNFVNLFTYWPLMPLYNNEVAFLSYSTTEVQFSATTKKIYIYDKNDVENYATATPKRSFNISQFSGMPAGGVSSYGGIAIIPTEHGDYLAYSKSTTELIVYAIPRTATEETIQPIQTITTTWYRQGTYLLFGKTCVFMANDSGTKQISFLRIDYDTSTSAPVINYKEITLNYNCKETMSGSGGLRCPLLFYAETQSEVVNPYITEYQSPSESYTKLYCTAWHNHTILNLSTPITLAAGDVLTVSYSISVG